MGAKGAQNITEAIAVMPQLNSLKCATSLLELPPPIVIKCLSFLVSSIGSNAIGDDGARALHEVILKESKALRTLK